MTKKKKRKRFIGLQGQAYELLENNSTNEKFDVTIKAFCFENTGFCGRQVIRFPNGSQIPIKVTYNNSKGRKTVIRGEYCE